jgi:hypothetical protein
LEKENGGKKMMYIGKSLGAMPGTELPAAGLGAALDENERNAANQCCDLRVFKEVNLI